MHPAQFMVTAMQIPHKSMFDHVCMFSLANRHVIVRSLKLPRFLVSLFYSCSEYMTILTLIQFNSATLFFSLFLSLSHSPYRHLSRLPCEEWRVLLCPQKNTIDYGEKYILQKMVSTKQRFLACSLHVDYKRRNVQGI